MKKKFTFVKYAQLLDDMYKQVIDNEKMTLEEYISMIRFLSDVELKIACQKEMAMRYGRKRFPKNHLL